MIGINLGLSILGSGLTRMNLLNSATDLGRMEHLLLRTFFLNLMFLSGTGANLTDIRERVPSPVLGG